jgi:uncharacterized protein HemX
MKARPHTTLHASDRVDSPEPKRTNNFLVLLVFLLGMLVAGSLVYWWQQQAAAGLRTQIEFQKADVRAERAAKDKALLGSALHRAKAHLLRLSSAILWTHNAQQTCC